MVSAAVVPGDPPRHPLTARGLIRDLEGLWLIVRPVGDERWHLPGGLIEQDESPRAACRREIHEELGVDLTPGPLLAVSWSPKRDAGHSARVSFVFDMGAHVAAELMVNIRLKSDELADWKWAAPREALTILHPDMATRLSVVRGAPPTATYIEHPELAVTEHR